MSINQKIADLEQIVQSLASRPQISSFGPGQISTNKFKSKWITSNMINVSDLQSVATSTGSLSVTGGIDIGAAGLIKSGQTDFNTGTGFYMDNNAGTPRFSVGSTGAGISWDGSTFSATGNMTANTLTANGSGSIAGWNIDSGKLSADQVGIASSGTQRIWSGNLASPTLANFQVDNTGNIKAAGGEIAGWTVDSSKFSLGTTSTTVGIGQSGSERIWAGGATASAAPFRVNSSGGFTSTNASVTGAVTANSGSFTGSINTSNISATGGSLAGLTIGGTLEVGTSGVIRSGATSYASGTGFIMEYNGGNPRFRIGTATSGTNYLAYDATNGLQLRGVFNFGANGADKLNNDGILFEMTGSTRQAISFQRSGTSSKGDIEGFISGGTADIQLKSTSSGGGFAQIDVVGQSNAIVAGKAESGSDSAYFAADIASGPRFDVQIDNTTMFEVDGSTTLIATAHLNLSNITARTPTDTDGLTPQGWLELKIGGTAYSVPYFN